jgi:hypothetical protein
VAVKDEEYAILSNAVYRDADLILPENYGFTKELDKSDGGIGFYAAAYKRESDNEVIIAYRGSDNRLNYYHDLIMVDGIKPPEFDKAMEFYDEVETYCKKHNLSLVGMTGHSLGGSMVQFVNAKLAIERGYQIGGAAFAPAGIGRLFPGLDVSSIAVKNFIREGDWVPELMNKQLGNPEWNKYLPRKDQSYSVQYTEGIGYEFLSRPPGVFAQHSMLGYLVDVAHFQTRPAKDAVVEYCDKVNNAIGDDGIWPGIEMDKLIVAQMLEQGYRREDVRYALETCSLSKEKDIAQYIEQELGAARFAAGGHMESGQVSGPGTGTSDSILAWLGNKGKFIKISNGEYVIRANAVQKWGTNFLDSINNGLIPQEFYNVKGRYATGGSISDNSVKKPQESLGEALRNLALTIIQSIQKNYAQELIKQIMSGLGLGTAASKYSDPWILSNGTRLPQDFGFKRDANSSILGLPSGGHVESGQVEQKAEVLFSTEKGLSAAPQQADYNRELAKTPTLLDEIHQASKQALKDGLFNFLTEGIMQCQSLGDEFRNFTISVLQSIQKIYAEAMTKNIMSMLGLGDQTSRPDRPTVEGVTVQGPLKPDGSFAKGGHIQGPGTGTSDSILSWLSNGEFVIKASSVQKYGTNFLHSLNNGFLPKNLMPHFAAGGLVGASVEGASGIANSIQGGDVTVPLKVVNVTDTNEVGRYLMTRPGERIMVNFMKNNAGIMRQILSIKG